MDNIERLLKKMDNIERLLKEIKEDLSIWKERRRDGRSFNIQFSSNFLNDVAEVFEKHGFGTTKTFLLDKREKRKLRSQANSLLKVIAKFEKYPEIRANRAKGRLIIKTLDALKGMEEV
jgi:hypothetical protein